MLEDAAILQTLHGPSFFFFFWGEQRDFSASGQRENPEGCILEKIYMETFSCFPKQKMLRGLLLRENSCTSFAKAGISAFSYCR